MNRFINNTKTALFLGLLFALILVIGSQFGQQGLIIAFLFGGMTNLVAYFFSDKIALASVGAQRVDENNAPELLTMVERLAKNAGIPTPAVYVSQQEAPNAFATGRNPSHAAVCVTTGAMRLLSFDELEGVIGHELSHVKNRDTLISAVAATIAGAISFLGQMAFFMGMGGRSNRNEGNAIVALLTLIFAPIAAMMIQLAISRSREYVADADGARIAGTPDGLINALRKLDATNKQIPLVGINPAQNQMFIVEPFSGGGLAGLFATHPPMEERIRRLQELKG